MARPRKEGKRAKGIQSKKGKLYIVFTQTIIKDGVKKSETKWISTGLSDTPENVKTASEMRRKILNQQNTSLIEKNISLADYTDHVLAKKKREVSDTTYSAYYYRCKNIKNTLVM